MMPERHKYKYEKFCPNTMIGMLFKVIEMITDSEKQS